VSLPRKITGLFASNSAEKEWWPSTGAAVAARLRAQTKIKMRRVIAMASPDRRCEHGVDAAVPIVVCL
jgi:hypothetical protein